MKLHEMRLNDVYRSDERYDKMGAAQEIVDWYDEVYDVGGMQKDKLDELFRAYDLSGDDPEMLFRKLLQMLPQELNRLYRNAKRVMLPNR